LAIEFIDLGGTIFREQIPSMEIERGAIWRVWIPLLAGLVGLGVIFRSGPRPHELTRLLGLFVGLLGLSGEILSRYTLGRSFSIAPRATALITTGIYSRVRNPIYIFGMIFIVGVILILRRLELLAIPLVLIPVQIVRARREAAALEARFGDAYRDYRKRTWF
jgi:protein-S-isoprenylcysteine O-methyltransferase Ste14